MVYFLEKLLESGPHFEEILLLEISSHITPERCWLFSYNCSKCSIAYVRKYIHTDIYLNESCITLQDLGFFSGAKLWGQCCDFNKYTFV